MNDRRQRRLAGLIVVVALALLGLGLVMAEAAGGRRAAAQSAVAAATPPTTIMVLTPDKTIYPKFCNNFVVVAPPGTTWRGFLSHVSDPSVVVSIWKYDNAKQAYYGVYFGDPNAPTDGPATTDQYGFTLPIWICSSQQGTFQ
jgi:hypothetical protein